MPPRSKKMALPAVIEPCLPSPGERPPTGPNWIHEIKHDGYRLMARRDALSVGIRLLTRNGHYPLIVEGFDDTLAGYRRAARHRRHATLDSVPARRLRRCLGRSRAFVSGRGVSVCLDVAEAGGALRANGSLESIFEFLLVKPPRESPVTSCSSTPARWGLRASCRSGWARDIGRAGHPTGSSSRTRRRRGAAEQRDELAPGAHSITSSARASSAGGNSRPSIRAV